MNDKNDVKPLFWVGSSKNDLRQFPEEVQDEVGYALYQAQIGEKHKDAKPLRGFGAPGSWRWSKITTGIPTAPCTLSSLQARFMSSMPSRKNQGAEQRRRSRTWI